MRLKHFVRQSFIGGVLILAPVAILFLLFRWAFNAISNLIQPLTNLLMARIGAPEWLIDLLVIGLIVLICFMVGTLASTGLGRWLHHRFDHYLVKLAPGYQLIKEIIHQLIGDSQSSVFSSGVVVRAKLFGDEVETSVTGLITSEHPDGFVTIFVPTGPNPTSGMIYHLPEQQVERLSSVKVEEAFRTIIACGAGSGEILCGEKKG